MVRCWFLQNTTLNYRMRRGIIIIIIIIIIVIIIQEFILKDHSLPSTFKLRFNYSIFFVCYSNKITILVVQYYG